MNESTYEVVTSPSGQEVILRTDADGSVWSIPVDESNSDYTAYLVWLEAQEN